MTFRDLEGKDLGIMGLEETEGSRDNLGQTQGREYVPVDEISGDYMTPAEIAEERDEVRSRAKDSEVSPADELGLAQEPDFDDGLVEKSNWEDAVEKGEFDNVEGNPVGPSFQTQDRVYRTEMGEMTKKEKSDSKYESGTSGGHVPQPEKPREKWGTVNPNKN
jgi:hypothetical protein